MSQLASLTIKAGSQQVAVTGQRYGAHRWRTQMGLTPVLVEYRLPVGDAAVVLAQKEVSITITPANSSKPDTWERIVVVGEGPSDDPEVRVVLLSDTRWYLLRVNLISSYNVPVYSGTAFLTNIEASFNVQPFTDEITYALPTLRNDGSASPLAWKAFEVIDDVTARLTRLVGLSGAPSLLIFRNLSSLKTRGTWNPQALKIDAQGDHALGQALGTVGGVDARVAKDGAIEIVDAMLGAEKSVIQSACTSSLASGAGMGATPKGVMRFCAMNHVAPTSLLIEVTRELEVRSDLWEQPTPPATAAALYQSDAPWSEWVLRVVDLVLRVSDASQSGAAAAFAVQSSAIPVDTWMAGVAAKNDASNAPSGYEAITRAIVQQNFFSDVLTKLYADSPVDPLGPSTIWSARIGEIMAHYRRLARLNPRFARRCVPGTIVPLRAALLNPATGERQPAPVIRDFYTKPTTRGLIVQQRFGNQSTCVPPIGGQVFPAGSNGRTYSDTSFPNEPFLLSQGQYAPFKLGCEDNVVGIFNFSPRLLPGTEVSQVIPGLLSQPPGLDTFDIEKDSEIPYFEFCELVASDRVAFIFSAVPVGPNGEAQTHTYEVDYVTALSRLGVGAQAVTAQGPKQTIRIGDGIQRARVAWDDNLRQQILGAFMTGQGDPQQLVPVNDKALADYAISCSAVYMATMLDHYEGTQEIGFSPTIEPIGSLQVVEHVVTATGEVYTDLHCTNVTPPLRPEAFMSQSSQNILWGNLGSTLPV